MAAYHFALPPHRKAVEALRRAQVAKDRLHKGQARPLNRSGLGRIDFCAQLLGERRFGLPAQAGQRFAPRLGGR